MIEKILAVAILMYALLVAAVLIGAAMYNRALRIARERGYLDGWREAVKKLTEEPLLKIIMREGSEGDGERRTQSNLDGDCGRGAADQKPGAGASAGQGPREYGRRSGACAGAGNGGREESIQAEIC